MATDGTNKTAITIVAIVAVVAILGFFINKPAEPSTGGISSGPSRWWNYWYGWPVFGTTSIGTGTAGTGGSGSGTGSGSGSGTNGMG